MRKKTIQNIIIAIIAISIIGAIVVYSYSVDKTKQKGLEFGIQLEQIQTQIKDIQTKFYSEKTRWEEGDISKDELLAYYENHLVEFEKIILKYNKLNPPELFKSSVDLLKFSSEKQLQSDTEFIKWIKTGEKIAKVRSDTQLQESLEYELQGLVEFYSAKTGVTNYDEPDKFQAPQLGLTQKIIKISDNMKENCNKIHSETDSEWSSCISEAEEWKNEHLP